MKREFKRSNLSSIASFSIMDNWGGDFWSIYKDRTDELIIVVHFSQSAMGWETENWNYFILNEKNSPIYHKIIRTKNHRIQCQLILQISLKNANVV